ncbi:Zinc/iron permease [Armillaria luteobubalina]|uniref:Zinc/iron permease n=1 Tax=Armillaria luteobubalina TaxID=153913 RepID=A0AA39QGJ6_9AGAR|nr:Zinc/iron permease [Armillaria luteobubalina]
MSSPMHIFTRDDDDAPNCGSGGGADTYFGLRVASIFIILVGSTFGASFPVLAKNSSCFAKYFGSGVIIATAFIHLLSPALDALSSECLAPGWQVYVGLLIFSLPFHDLTVAPHQPYALALCMFSIFSIFILELIAFRWGTKKLAKIGMSRDAHGHLAGGHAAHGPEGDIAHHIELGNVSESKISASESDLGVEDQQHRVLNSAMTQIIGVAILEFGVTLHSVLIGLTLAVDPDFKVLFVVLIFHQTFEGLGVGSRLAYLDLPPKYRWAPYAGAALYGLTTPIGIAAGLGVRTTYNPGSTTASIVSGTPDALSSGILIYTGLVELLAHEFLFNKEMMTGSNGKLAYAIGCMLAGCGIMALLGRWAWWHSSILFFLEPNLHSVILNGV